MNAGVKNEAIRCFHATMAIFERQLRYANPDVPLAVTRVSPRDVADAIPEGFDFYLSSGGPGSPLDSEGTPWGAAYGKFLDYVYAAHEKGREDAPGLMAVCYSFELVVLHFRVARLAKRAEKKFGVQPQYTTEAGRAHPLLAMFKDRIFAFEHRNWDALDPNAEALRALGGAVLAGESRPGLHDKGESITALHVGHGIETTLFHPEADRAGIHAWIDKPEAEAEFKEAYGNLTHERMMKTIAHPERIDRAHKEVIPSFIRRHVNRLAPVRGWDLIPEPLARATRPPGTGTPRC
jgi:hypothetical protein